MTICTIGACQSPKDGIDAAEAEKVKQRLTVLQWMVAFDHFALTAAVCPIDGEKGEPIWRYSSAMCHKHIVFKVCRWGVGSVWRAQVCFLQVMAGAEASSRKIWLGIVYDRLARQQWARRAYVNEVPLFTSLVFRLGCAFWSGRLRRKCCVS